MGVVSSSVPIRANFFIARSSRSSHFGDVVKEGDITGDGGFDDEDCVLFADAVGKAIVEGYVGLEKTNEFVDCFVAGYVCGVATEIVFPRTGVEESHSDKINRVNFNQNFLDSGEEAVLRILS